MDSADVELLSVTVDLWHPSCWTLAVSEATEATLLGTGTTLREGTATGRYTLSGPDSAALDAAVDAIRASPLTDRMDVLSPRAGGGGTATRSVLVEFDAGPSIRDAFTDRGFVHDGRTRHEDGRERRSFLVRASRTAVRRDLDAVAEAYDADVDLRRLAAATGPDEGRGSRLSPRQREAFELARERGYYAYPREVTATALAETLGVSKTTYLEHLRKAEGKLLAGVGAE